MLTKFSLIHKVCACAVLAMLALPTTTQAVTVPSVTMTAGSDAIPMSQTTWSGIFRIPQFNPALGTLIHVNFELATTAQGSVSYENTDTFSSAILSISAGADITLENNAGIGMMWAYPTSLAQDSVTAYDGILDYAGTSGNQIVTPTTSKTEYGALMSSHDDLSAYIGTGLTNHPVYANPNFSISGSPSIAEQHTVSASATLTIRYTYTPVPEPASLSLLALGGAALIRRR